MHLRPTALPDDVGQSLEALQAEIDAIPAYPERVRHARERFKSQNRPDNQVFEVVRRSLEAICGGHCRCMYCEDSAACEVEHFRPKTFYPDLVFVWMNYLYSCGPCNRAKSSHFRVHSGASGFIDLVRHRGDPVVEPTKGLEVLIDPRNEDPLHYMSLDLRDTFLFVPRYPKGTLKHARADYTITLLRLNDRDFLRRRRHNEYLNYRARLREYVAAKGTAEAEPLARAMASYPHTSVWAEIKAQSHLIPDLAALFDAAPEASAW